MSATRVAMPGARHRVARREFGTTARLAVRLPAETVEPFRQAVSYISRGQARVAPASPGRLV